MEAGASPLDACWSALNTEGTGRSADCLETLLASRMDLRLDAQRLLDQLPEQEITSRTLLARTVCLNHLDAGRLGEAEHWAVKAAQSARGIQKADCLLDQAVIARDWTNWEKSTKLIRQAELLGLTPSQSIRALNMKAVHAMTRLSDFKVAGAMFEEIERLAIKEGDQIGYLTAIINRGLGVERVLGRADRMEECAATIDRHYRGMAPLEDRIYRERLRAEAALMTGSPQGHEVIQRLVDCAGEAGNPNAAGYGLSILALWHARYGDPSSAADLSDQAIQACLPFNSSITLARLAKARLASREGSFESAFRLSKEACESESSLDRRLMALLEAALGQHGGGSLEKAESAAMEALDLAEKLGAEADWILAALLVSGCQHRPKLAERALEKAGELGLVHHVCRVGGLAVAPCLTRCLAEGICLDLAKKGLGLLDQPYAVITCLGEMEIWTHKGRVSRSMWKRPKARSLVACLFALGPGPVHSLELMDLLWPDAEPDEARNSLRVTAAHARAAISPLGIELSGGMVKLSLPPAIHVDFWRLRESRSRGREVDLARSFLDHECFVGITDDWVHSARADAESWARAILAAASREGFSAEKSDFST